MQAHLTASCNGLVRLNNSKHHLSRSCCVVGSRGTSSSCRTTTSSSSTTACPAGSRHYAAPSLQVQHGTSTVAVFAAPKLFPAKQPTMQSGMQGQVDPDYLAAASYLAKVGFTNKTEIARVLDVAMNPNSLFVTASVNANARPLTVETDMKPVVDFLQSRGVSVGDTVKVISTHPPVLSYSVEGRLVPFWDYLTQIGVTDVAAAVIKRPSLLGLSVDANLRKIVDYLESVGTPPEKIVQYICTSI